MAKVLAILREMKPEHQTVEDLLNHDSSRYHRLYHLAKSHGLSLAFFWAVCYIDSKRVGLLSLPELRLWLMYDGLAKQRWDRLPITFRECLAHYAKRHKLTITAVCASLEIPGYSEPSRVHIYDSIAQIRLDLADKGLQDATPKMIQAYDRMITYSNIERFGKRQGLTITQVWQQLATPIHRKFKINDNGIMERRTYYDNIDQIRRDFIANNYQGMSAKEIQLLDNNRTYTRVYQFAKQNQLDLKQLWRDLGITCRDY